MQDTGHVLVDNLGCGSKHRQLIEEQIKSGQRSFREASEEMWGSLQVPFESGFEVMEKQLEMDEGFQDFHQFCIDKGIDFNIISAGLKPVLRKVLDTFLGEDKVRLESYLFYPFYLLFSFLIHTSCFTITLALGVSVSSFGIPNNDITNPTIVFENSNRGQRSRHR